MWKFQDKKNWSISFKFIFVKGYFTCKFMEMGFKEGAIALILEPEEEVDKAQLSLATPIYAAVACSKRATAHHS